jgi:hypothetical protein
MVPLHQFPFFIHICALWISAVAYIVVNDVFKTRRVMMPITMKNPHQRRAQHRAVTIAAAILSGAVLLTFASVFLPDNMRRL